MGGKTSLSIRDSLRLDLKDPGSNWSNAELDRCIQRAVSDLSRMLPLEKVYEKRLSFTVTDEAYTSPVDTDADRFVDAQRLDGSGTDMTAGDTFTLTGTQPDFPRVVTITLTDADDSITNWSIIVKGTDTNDKSIEEAFHFGNGKTQTGKKEFKTIREVELDQIAGSITGTSDVLDVGCDAYTTCWVELANKPIKPGLDTGHSASLVRNTDYIMDYYNGRIQLINGAAATAYTVSYIVGQIWLDLSSLPDLIRVDSAVYPVGSIPQDRVSVDIWGTTLVITGGPEDDEQSRMASDQHIAVYYSAQHNPPTEFSSGSYPEFLEDTILLAAGAYALFLYATKYEHEAASNLESAKTTLATVTHDKIATALSSGVTASAKITTALDKIDAYLAGGSESAKALLAQIATDIAQLRTATVTAHDAANAINDGVTFAEATIGINACITNAQTALGKIITYLESNSSEDSKFWLTSITTDIANTRGSSLLANDAANAQIDAVSIQDATLHIALVQEALSKVGKYLENNSSEDSKFWMTKITTDLADLRTSIRASGNAAQSFAGNVDTHDIDRAETTRKGYIADKDMAGWVKSFIDEASAVVGHLTEGGENERTPEVIALLARTMRDSVVGIHEQDRQMFLQAAQHRTGAALAYIQEMAQRIASLRTYIEQSDGWGRIAERFIGEATQQVRGAEVSNERERLKLERAAQYIAEAGSRLAEFQTYIDQATGWGDIARGFANEGAHHMQLAVTGISKERVRLEQANAYVAEADSRLASLRTYIEQAMAYATIARGFHDEGAMRVEEYKSFLEEANTRLAEIAAYIAESDRFVQIGEHNTTLAARFREEAIVRRDEAWSIWRDRRQYIGDFTQSSVRQMPK